MDDYEFLSEARNVTTFFANSISLYSLQYRVKKLLITDNAYHLAYLAYLSTINADFNELLCEFLNLPTLIFIPARNWSRDVEDIPEEAKSFPPPLILEVESLRNVSKEYYNFLFQMGSARPFRETAFNNMLLLEDKYFDIPEYLIISRETKKELNLALIQLDKEIWQILEDFQNEAPAREFYFLDLLKLLMSEALKNQSLGLYEQLIQLGMIPELFLFPITYHTRSIMSFANIKILEDFLKDYFTLYPLPNSITIEYQEVNRNDKIMIPVMRYQNESGTLFFNNSEDQEYNNFCGTFYYFEPESEIYLLSDNVLIARNKIHAAAILGFSEDEIVEILFRNSEDPLDLELIRSFMDGNNVPLENYAMEDPLDQPICARAKDQNYKVIVLTEMVGTNRYVTEILDTRIRAESFKNLIRIKY